MFYSIGSEQKNCYPHIFSSKKYENIQLCQYLIVLDILCIDGGPVEGENDLVGEPAVVEGVQVDELDVRKRLVPLGDAPAAFAAVNAAGEIKKSAIPPSQTMNCLN